MDLHAAWLACMRCGDFPGAWAVSADVLAGHDPATRDDPRLPYHQRWVWDGRPFAGRHVLVRCYHGLGDTLMFARFLPLLRRQAALVTLECQPALVPLLAGMPGVDRLVPFDVAAPLPPAECDIEIMELSFALRAAPVAVPPPSLGAFAQALAGDPFGPGRAPPSPAVAWEGAAAAGAAGETVPRVGLCWQAGNWDPERVIPPALLRPLAERWPCVSLVPGPTDLPVLNPQGCPDAVAETAAMIAGLDLVITVDTMVAHLAGSLGRPTWLLLRHEADWRWMDGRSDSPWYPSMRLYRQDTPGSWTGVIARMRAELARMLPPQSLRAEEKQSSSEAPQTWIAAPLRSSQ